MKNLVLILSVLISMGQLNASNPDLPETKKTMRAGQGINPVKNPIKKSGANYFAYCNPYKVSTFCYMIQRGNITAVKNLLEDGQDINKFSNNLTPLMYAARHNRVEIIKLLLEHGADPYIKSKKGYTALKWAKMVKATEAEALLTSVVRKRNS